MPVRRILNLFGRLLVAAGVLVLLFVAFQLWGTGILETHSQSVLRQRLAHELPNGTADFHPPIPRAGAPGVSDRPAPTTAAPAEGQPVGFMDIPAIGVSQVIVQGVGTDDLRMGPGHYPGTPLPGQRGNVAIAGHRTTYAHPFYDLNELVRGDRIVIVTPQGIFVYRVRTVTAVAPTDTAVLAPSSQALLTLTTCNPRYSASQRLVLRAALSRALLFSSYHGRRPAAGHAAQRGVANSTELAGASVSGSWIVATGWGLLLVACCVAVWLVGRRSRRRWRWAVYGLGAVAVAAVLFGFFYALSPLLPASF